jgi:hypothetical protein
LNANTPYGNDSLHLVILPDIKVSTTSMLDSVLMKEFNIALVDYYYYYGSYQYLNQAQRRHPAILASVSYVPIITDTDKIMLRINLNGKHVLYDINSHLSTLSKVKEVDSYTISRKDHDHQLEGNFVTIDFIVNNNFIGTPYEIGNANGSTIMKVIKPPAERKIQYN